MRYSLSGAVILACAAMACGGGSTRGTSDITGDSIVDSGPATDIGPPFIDTVLTKDELKAGETTKVNCEGHGFDPGNVEIRVWTLIKPPAEVDVAEVDVAEADVAEADVAEGIAVSDAAIGQPDTGGWTGQLPEGVTLDKAVLRFTIVGSYAVQCTAPDEGMQDDTPAQVLVGPGNPLNVETEVSTHEVTAGEWVDVTCSAWDAYGNQVEQPVLPVVKPAEGTTTSGLSVRLTVAVPHEIACAVQNTSVMDVTPEVVNVKANVPKKIYTIVDPEHFTSSAALPTISTTRCQGCPCPCICLPT
ncbi:MAG: hypothetical protein GXP54_05030 [Deltaproteobacteria bacterium]|nr:hypothetical protein [Deltaproteobacteria bacterium]